MQCPTCKMMNDPDAEFCQECGRALNNAVSTRSRRSYLFMFVLVPVLALIAGVGYYKFFLPSGIAAVVNSEEISTSELDAVVARAQGNNGAPSGRVRHQFLNQLILERIVLQEARKAGMSVPQEDVASAAAETQRATGLDASAFHKEITSQYGSMRLFTEALGRRLLMNKYLSEKVVPPGADPQTARMAVDRWMQDLEGRATVRIALAEQGGRAGCGNCDSSQKKPCTMQGAGCGDCDQSRKKPCVMSDTSRGDGDPSQQKRCAMSNAGKRSGDQVRTKPCPLTGAGSAGAQAGASTKTRAAVDAGLRYWHEKHGQQAVAARAIDYGCHVQVDIVENEKIIGSLRYQNGSITEL